jgi:hypothetical protein
LLRTLSQVSGHVEFSLSLKVQARLPTSLLLK